MQGSHTVPHLLQPVLVLEGVIADGADGRHEDQDLWQGCFSLASNYFDGQQLGSASDICTDN